MPATGTDMQVTLLHENIDGMGLGTWYFTTPFGILAITVSQYANRVPAYQRDLLGHWTFGVITPPYHPVTQAHSEVKVGRSTYPVVGDAVKFGRGGHRLDGRFRMKGSSAPYSVDRPISATQEELLRPVIKAMIDLVATRLPDPRLQELQDQFERMRLQHESIHSRYRQSEQQLEKAMTELAELRAQQPSTVSV